MSESIERVETLPELPPRTPDGHKGDYGRVLVVGGSRGMPGAVALAANAALRGGAGLVTFAAPEPVQLTVAQLCPCATSLPLACTREGELAAQSVRQLRKAAGTVDVLAVGPGLVLKGAGTVITDGRRVRINETGNPGMATGGSGDVLTGLTAALLAQGLSAFDAAALAAHLHGRAGDLAARQLSQPSVMASDLLNYLPLAMREVTS